MEDRLLFGIKALKLRLQAQGFQDLGALHRQPLDEVELFGRPFLRLAAVDAYHAEGPFRGPHGRGKDGPERSLARRLEQGKVGAEGGVGQGGRLVLRHDHLGEAIGRGQRFEPLVSRGQAGLAAGREPAALQLPHDHGRRRGPEDLLAGGTDFADHRLLGGGQAGRIQQFLQHLLAVRQRRVERCDLLALCLQLLVLLGKLLGLLRQFLRLLRQFLVQSRQLVQLPLLREAERLSPSSAAKALPENAQEEARAREDPQAQGVVGGLDGKTPIRPNEPVIGRQGGKHGGHDPRSAAADDGHQQDRRVKRDKQRQLTEGTLQPPAQHRGHGHDDHRGGVLAGDRHPFPPRRNRRRRGTAEAHAPHQHHRRDGQYEQRRGRPCGNRPDGPLGAGVGRCVPLLQELPLAVLHLGDHGPQIVHDLPAPIGFDDRQSGIQVGGPAELDRLVQLGKLGVGQLSDLPQALLLVRVVAGQLDQRVNAPAELFDGGTVGLQVRLFSGEQKAPLTGLGILEDGENLLEALDHLVAVRHPAVRFQEPLCAHVGADADGRDDHQSGGKGGPDLASRRHAALR